MAAAMVLELQRMSTEDGPGIRTTVFFKGCTLKCSWCQNPEGLSIKPQVQWIGSRCIDCRTCIGVCKAGALSAKPEGIIRNRALCKVCSACVEACPSTAMEMIGRKWVVDDLVREVVKDRAYFEKSGGGITASGGEPAVQAGFVSQFFKALKEKGVHTALDTCGMGPDDSFLAMLPHTDMVMYDLKEIDPEKHKSFTGSSNEKILKNIIAVKEHMKSRGTPKELWVRTPVIPDATATEENIKGIGRFICSELGDFVGRWELCSFNNLCRDKYTRLDMEWKFKDYSLVTKELMERLAEAAKSSGVKKEIVHWSGMTRLEDKEKS